MNTRNFVFLLRNFLKIIYDLIISLANPKIQNNFMKILFYWNFFLFKRIKFFRIKRYLKKSTSQFLLSLLIQSVDLRY